MSPNNLDHPSPHTSGWKAILLGSGKARPAIVVFFATVIICLTYATYTDHAWEDWYITFRASKNLATGKGLTFTEGERVYSFTSPLGTTLPALCSVLAGAENDHLALWFYRIISATLLGIGNVILLAIARDLGFGRWAKLALCASLMLESKIIDHTISGMETGIMVFFLALTLRACTATKLSRPWLILGIAWGGLMWTRPDGFVYGGAIAAGFLAFPCETSLGADRRTIFANYLRALTVGATLFAPWLIGTWLYYGSPIPHTIAAKTIESSKDLGFGALLLKFLTLPFTTHPPASAFDQALTPSYARIFGDWPLVIFHISHSFVLLASYYWINPRAARLARAASVATMFVTFYLTDITPHAMPWYLPNLGLLVFFTLSLITHDVLQRIQVQPPTRHPQSGPLNLLTKGAIVVLIAYLATTLGATAIQSRWQQKLVEDGVRTRIGIWLRENAASSKDTVMLECLGYIGFFSGLKMYDYPGMGTPEMVAARKRLARSHGPYVSWGSLSQEQKNALIRDMKPDWLVLRTGAAIQLHTHDPSLLTQAYRQRKDFSSLAEIDAVPFLPGRPFLKFDSSFVVFSRNRTATD